MEHRALRFLCLSAAALMKKRRRLAATKCNAGAVFCRKNGALKAAAAIDKAKRVHTFVSGI